MYTTLVFYRDVLHQSCDTNNHVSHVTCKYQTPDEIKTRIRLKSKILVHM